ASAAGVTAQTLLGAWPRVGATAAWLVVGGSLALGVLRFYDTPAIFGYDPFAGYFPGTLYDENIRLGAAFAAARRGQFLLAASALAAAGAARLTGRRRAPGLVLAVFGVAGAIAIRTHAADFGTVVTADDLRARMARIETRHFEIYYPGGAP